MKRIARPRFASRLARREVRRYAGRTTLLVVMIALAVAGAFVGSGLWALRFSDPDNNYEQRFGQAAGASVEDVHTPISTLLENVNIREDPQALLVRTTNLGPWDAEATDLPIDNPLTKGIFDLLSGRAPHAKNEVALSAPLLKALNAHVGDFVSFGIPEGIWKVTGEVRLRRDWNRAEAVFGSFSHVVMPDSYPAELGPSTFAGLSVDAPYPGTDRSEFGILLISHDARRLDPRYPPVGLIRRGTGTTASDSGDFTKVAVEAGALLSFVMSYAAFGLLIAAGFSASITRQIRTAGLLSINGATSRTIRRVGLFQGIWTGILGTVLGGGIGLLCLSYGKPVFESLYHRNLDSLMPPPVFLVAIPLTSVAVAALAAMYPARALARMPVSVALAGRHPKVRQAPWRTQLALGVAAASIIAWRVVQEEEVGPLGSLPKSSRAPLAIFSILGLAVGICLLSPRLVDAVSKGRLARRLLGLQIAARELARNYVSSGALVSAIAAVVLCSGYVSLAPDIRWSPDLRDARRDSMVFVRGDVHGEVAGSALTNENYAREAWPLVMRRVDQVTKLLPNAHSLDVRGVLLPQAEQAGHIAMYVATPEFLDFIQVPDQHRRLLAEADVLSWNSGISFDAVLPSSKLRYIEASTADEALAPGGEGFVRHVRIAPSYWGTGRAFVVSEAAAQAHHLNVITIGKLLVNPKPLSDTMAKTIYRLSHGVANEPSAVEGNNGSTCCFEVVAIAGRYSIYGNDDASEDPVPTVAMGVAGVIILGLIVMGFSLRAFETRRENSVLALMGARDGLISRVAGWKAYVLTQVGTILGVGAATAVLVFAERESVDTLNIKFLLILLFGIPIGIGLAAALCSAIALRFRPIRVEPSFAD